MHIDYPQQDFSFTRNARERPLEALLEGGPLHRQIMYVDAVEEREVEAGFYKFDPGVTYIPEPGKRYGLFRWIPS